MIPLREMELPEKLSADRRARPAPAPSPERLRELARAIAEGRYRVPPEEVAAAIVASLRGRPAPRD
jgi:anti-sigma28 factor (negative regulator of flagellin synthesis)